MNSSGEFLNGSRAAAVVGLLLPLGKGGQASVQAEPRQLWGLGGRDPQLGKSSSGHPRLNAGITRLDSRSTLLATSLLRVGLRKPRVCKLEWDEKDIEPSMGREQCAGIATGPLSHLPRNGQTIVSDSSPKVLNCPKSSRNPCNLNFLDSQTRGQ